MYAYLWVYSRGKQNELTPPSFEGVSRVQLTGSPEYIVPKPPGVGAGGLGQHCTRNSPETPSIDGVTGYN